MARILVIDDDAVMRRLMVRILSVAGHVVFEAGGGEDGLTAFALEQPQIVIVDILMPEKDGIETIRGLIAAGSATGIIAVSGGGAVPADYYLDLAERFGAHRYLGKPFAPSALIELVDSLVD